MTVININKKGWPPGLRNVAEGLTLINQNYFSFRDDTRSLVPPKHKNSILTFSESARYLGLVLDRKLNWKLNIQERSHSSILFKQNNIPPKTDYCMPIENITTPFRTLIPRREEVAVKPPGKPGSLTFYTDRSKLKNQTYPFIRDSSLVARPIKGFHHQATKENTKNTTPGEALDAILNITPTQQLSKVISTLSAIRLRDTNLWNDHPSAHSSILFKQNNIPPKTDYCMPIENITTPFRTLIPRREEVAVKPPGKPGSLTFYTDRSKLKNQGRKGTRCPNAQDRPYVVKNHILHEVPLLLTKYGGSREDNSNKTRNLRCYSYRAYGMNGTTLMCL
ncbi:hypothetical protein ACLKA6_010502 [Drosophila palustris]